DDSSTIQERQATIQEKAAVLCVLALPNLDHCCCRGVAVERVCYIKSYK
ncbi:16741_t:CDS:2, partial [Dentiscutata erythropus]